MIASNGGCCCAHMSTPTFLAVLLSRIRNRRPVDLIERRQISPSKGRTPILLSLLLFLLFPNSARCAFDLLDWSESLRHIPGDQVVVGIACVLTCTLPSDGIVPSSPTSGGSPVHPASSPPSSCSSSSSCSSCSFSSSGKTQAICQRECSDIRDMPPGHQFAMEIACALTLVLLP